MNNSILKNPVGLVIFAALLLGCLVSFVKPVLYTVAGQRSEAVILKTELVGRAQATNADKTLVYRGEYRSLQGEWIPFSFSRNDKDFGAGKKEGKHFPVLVREGFLGGVMEADYVAIFRLPVSLLAVVLVLLRLAGKKNE